MENDANNKNIKVRKYVISVVALILLMLVGVALALKYNLPPSLLTNKDVATEKKLPFTPTKGNPDSSSASQPFLQLISKNKAMDYAVIEYKFQGRIKSIDEKGGVVPGTQNKPYQLLLVISVGTLGDSIPVSFPKEAMKTIRVFNQTGSGKKDAQLSDLKVGDVVIIRENIGILRKFPNNYNFVEITRVNP